MEQKNFVIDLLCALLTLILIGTFVWGIFRTFETPPMTGYISEKVHYPEYYPVTNLTPWRYELIITGYDGHSAMTWTVDADTYDFYEVGDHVRRGVRRNDDQSGRDN